MDSNASQELQNAYVESKLLSTNVFAYKKLFPIDSIWIDHFKRTLPEIVNDYNDAEAIITWSDQCIPKFEKFLKNGKIEKPIIVLEDTFFRSIDLFQKGKSKEYNDRWALPVGYTISNFAHYDIRGHGTLEKMLTDDFRPLSNSQINRTRSVIDYIKTHKLSKYNNQWNNLSRPISNKLKTKERKIIIVDQALNDQSVVLSKADKRVFELMLRCALKITPHVFIKIHPEQLVGRRKGYYNVVDDNEYQVYITKEKFPTLTLIGESVNPIELLEQFDEVWTVSSQLGFEALMLGKKVVCFGAPFYSGYGLTHDMVNHKVFEFRKEYKRTIEDIFYTTYIRYSHYFNPFNVSNKWEIEDVLSYLKEHSNQFKSQ